MRVFVCVCFKLTDQASLLERQKSEKHLRSSNESIQTKIGKSDKQKGNKTKQNKITYDNKGPGKDRGNPENKNRCVSHDREGGFGILPVARHSILSG